MELDPTRKFILVNTDDTLALKSRYDDGVKFDPFAREYYGGVIENFYEGYSPENIDGR